MDSEQRQANIRALISMLDESDPDLYRKLKEALFDLGETCLPYLEEAENLKEGLFWKNRIENLRKEVQIEAACRALQSWKSEKDPDLMRGYHLLSKAFYPQLEWESVREEFNRLHGDCWLLLSAASGLKQTVALYNNFFFNTCKFHIGQRITHAYDFADFFLPNLINLGQGNERSLSLAYQYLAARNRIPIFLLNLPVVNVLACTTDIDLPYKEDIRFCIDITQRGAMINRSDLEPVLTQQRQIRICNTVEAIQDYAKLLFLMTSLHEKDEFRKKAARKIHESLGSSPHSIPFSPGIGGTPEKDSL